ncbi:MAG: DinB family protein [Saprospiraceae bacterium]|nr:DinB family protein [Saprospiraceae bacterium]
MKRSEIQLPEYFDRYILMTDDVSVLDAFKISLEELQSAPIEKWKAIHDKVYAPNKWTIKDILQHLIDTEWTFSYRALAFARGEKEARSYDENQYAEMAHATQRTIENLLEEAIALRKASILLYQSFDEEMLSRKGMGFKGEYSVHAIGYILCGHQRWHFKIIEERYMPLNVIS